MNEDPSKFFHGKPCPQGHTQRYISTGDCVFCARERDRLNKAKKRRNKERKRLTIPENSNDFAHRVFVIGNPNRNI